MVSSGVSQKIFLLGMIILKPKHFKSFKIWLVLHLQNYEKSLEQEKKNQK